MTQAYATWIQLWPTLAAVLHLVLAAWASSHAVLTKDERAAVGWVGLIWLSPFVGAFLYYSLGINRIRRKALAIKSQDGQTLLAKDPLLAAGNAITPLVNGDQAYPAMLAAIAKAQSSIMLSSYIFDNDAAGQEFVEALKKAVARGVAVRVLIDATGARYSFPSILHSLKKAGVTAKLFLPNFRLTKIAFFNLRSHRKILVVDGRFGFTGGMNIRYGNYVQKKPARGAVQDLHFQVDGPVVAHLAQTFIEDWAFASKEVLEGPLWLPELFSVGQVAARGVKDGPDKDFEKLLWTLLGAIHKARRSIKIVTPYFLPDAATIRFLNVAALAGIQVDIILPARSNLRFFQWATMAGLSDVLANGCRVHLSEGPFDHSKLMLVDEDWAFIGSANWDTRSFRLNFEFNIECLSADLSKELLGIYQAKLAKSRPLTLKELQGRPLWIRLRDGVVRLAAPYM